MSEYMDHTHPDAFRGMAKSVEHLKYKSMSDLTDECPKCHGYGGWHLKFDAYGPGKHFKASCSQCTGWGYVVAGSLDATCIHELDHGVTVGRCLTRYTCKKCGKVTTIDSSD